jgi:hypothetical protein
MQVLHFVDVPRSPSVCCLCAVCCRTWNCGVAVTSTLDEQLQVLEASWADVFNLIQMAYFFEEPLQRLWSIVQRPECGPVIRERFNRCWDGLKAFQQAQGVSRAGDITMRMYSHVQESIGNGVVVFERDMSPVVRAMANASNGSGLVSVGSSPKIPKRQLSIRGGEAPVECDIHHNYYQK